MDNTNEAAIQKQSVEGVSEPHKVDDLKENSIPVPYFIARGACDMLIHKVPAGINLDVHSRVIELPVPVLDIRTWYDDSTNLEKMTGFSRDDLCRVIYCANALHKDENGHFVEGDLATFNPGQAFTDNDSVIGAAAIKEYLEQKFGSLDGMGNVRFISYIPIVFPRKDNKDCSGDAFQGFRSHLTRIALRAARAKRLMDLNAPFVIVSNEMRMLQEAVDSFLCNGKRGEPIVWDNLDEKIIGISELEEMCNG